MTKKFNVIIEKDNDGYYAYCPELLGCQSQGDSFEEVTANIREAIELYLETLPPADLEQFSNKEIYSTAMEIPLG
ncbi:MAG TPA: type II toxin-antitoxin system HicB family antitoxin [bacterium]|nr:type II toxin-antitoxin system HicB family antitoxin [bacterium]HOC90184.1 type II toxin-antitoxin system HicB family antitoxin [bacterium]